MHPEWRRNENAEHLANILTEILNFWALVDTVESDLSTVRSFTSASEVLTGNSGRTQRTKPNRELFFGLTRLSPFGSLEKRRIELSRPTRQTRQRNHKIVNCLPFGEHHFRLSRGSLRGLFVLAIRSAIRSAIRLANVQKASEDTNCKLHLKPVQALSLF